MATFVRRYIQAALEDIAPAAGISPDELAAEENAYRDISHENELTGLALDELNEAAATLEAVIETYLQVRDQSAAGVVTGALVKSMGRHLGVSTEGIVDGLVSVEGVLDVLGAIGGKIVAVFKRIVAGFKAGWRNLTYRWGVMVREVDQLSRLASRMEGHTFTGNIEWSKKQTEYLSTNAPFQLATELDKWVEVLGYNSIDLSEKIVAYVEEFIRSTGRSGGNWESAGRLLEQTPPPTPTCKTYPLNPVLGSVHGEVIFGRKAFCYIARPGDGHAPAKYVVSFDTLLAKGAVPDIRSFPAFQPADIMKICDSMRQVDTDSRMSEGVYRTLFRLECAVDRVIALAEHASATVDEVVKDQEGRVIRRDYRPGDRTAMEFLTYFSAIYRDTTSAISAVYEHSLLVGKSLIDLSHESMRQSGSV